MANVNAPYGLRQIGMAGSPPQNSALQERRNAILSTDTTAIYTGDLVRQSANGYWVQWTATTPANLCVGVFAGCRYASNSQQTTVPQKYWPGTDALAGTILAQVTPNSGGPLFVIQTDSTGITLAEIGLNFDIAVGTGSALTGRSGAYLDVSTSTTATTAPLNLVDLWSNYSMGNNPEGAGSPSTLAPGTQAGAYNWAVVRLNVNQGGI